MDALRMRFEHGPAAGAARRAVREALDRWKLGHLADDALLVTTELVQNAVVHAGDGGVLVVRRSAAGLRIEVADESRDEPTVRPPDPQRVGGRGLSLVAAVARAWGTLRSGQTGKIVWAELAA
ncbi:ATP-binding protein [Asanoa sp. WMMD1127]|uniref:ATP-binding protein n=1 Tax=Asanoa sp. WMMD1127 TaxID=3016107 RepID=UPI002416B7D3|nr:ATP-binding protein [Asanoa sp. WMMD1127]MDG4827483.1 ATP-binding protein [Asanoa sp. WMMD1127]